MFDPDTLLARVACPLSAWLTEGTGAASTPTKPPALTALYQRLMTRVAADGHIPCQSPAPQGMENIFASICSWNRQAAAWRAPAPSMQGSKRNADDPDRTASVRPRL
eukprot:12412898-Heterocapsa_arctica.AAC.1